MKKSSKKNNSKGANAPVVPKTELLVVYQQSSEGGDAIDPDDRWSSRTDEHRTVTFKALLREYESNQSHFTSFTSSATVSVDEVTRNSQTGYLAVIRYSDGDTFGHTSGMWMIVGCYSTYNDASAALLTALNAVGVYKPWTGYFASLEGTEVHPLPIS